MDKKEYLKLVDELTPKEDKTKNYLYAFLIGGMVGFIGEVIRLILLNITNMTSEAAAGWTSIIIILIACLFTGLGFFDDWVCKFKCGLIIPTTGFAHSVMSSSLDYKRDGLITGLGSNFFKLAGSVILYGIISGFVMGIIKVILNV